MGAVYLAEHTLLGRRAAVKVLQPNLSSNQDIVQRFFNEARAATAIADPGIVQIFDFGYHTDGSAYIVMEFLEGEPLDARLKRHGRLAPEEALRLLRQVASSLHAAHSRGIIHRDLKPENIFLVADREVAGGERAKILDFGIAKLSNNADSKVKTHTAAIMGTPMYMSPEQCRGAGHVDHRSDLYSLGCVLYHLVVGRVPFDGEGIGEIIAAHMMSAPPVPSQQAPGIPPGVDQLILRLLAKRPEDRPQSAAEAIRAIDDLLPRPAAASRRRALAIGAAIVVVFALAAGAFVVVSSAPGLRLFRQAQEPAQGPASIVSPAATRAPIPAPAISATPSPGARGTVTATVMANAEWQGSGLPIRPGDTVRIRQVSGAWSECALTGCAFHDAAGDPSAPRAQASNAVQGCPHASLVARAGEGMPFCVGAGASARADAGGELRLRINDTILFDNDGSVVVVVETSAP